MPSLTLHLHPTHPEPRKIRHAVEVLEKDGVALVPTDSTYALACPVDARKTIPRLYKLRQVDERKPLALLCADLSEIARYAVVTNTAYRLMRRVLPGPYTFLLEATREVPRHLMEKRRTMGLRVPECPITQELVRALGRPLVVTTATPPGAESACTDVDEAKAGWKSGIDVFLDGGILGTEPSTIVSFIGDEIEVVREGRGSLDSIV